MNMNEYLWKSSDAAFEMRLLVEGAITLYEEDALSLQSLARDNQQPEAAIAFNTHPEDTAEAAARWLRPELNCDAPREI